MTTLTINEVAPYLPYDLKMIFEKSGKIITLTGISKTSSGNLIFQDSDRFFENTIWDFKPLLRPMSDLTKHIEGIGIPIVELANMAFPKVNWLLLVQSNMPSCVSTNKETEIRFGFRHNCFTLYRQFDVLIPDQLELFQKLFEWHFDIFGLLDRNLALPINN